MPTPRSSGTQTELYRYASVGLQFAATIGVFAFLGYWADGKLGTDPWLLIVGVFLGFALGLVSLISKLSPRNGHRPSPHTDLDDR